MELIEQILLHLYGSLDYGMSHKMKKELWISNYFDRWKKEYGAEKVKSNINKLKRQKLVKEKKDYDGSILTTLTEKGRLKALNSSFRNFSVKKEKWDGNWRMIMFDIPDKCRKGRDAIRYRFKLGEFYELQESVFLYPYDCAKEIRDLVNVFNLQKYVRFGILNFIDNEHKVKTHFSLQ